MINTEKLDLQAFHIQTDKTRALLAAMLREIATLLETGCVYIEGDLLLGCKDGLIHVDSNLVIKPGVIQ